MQTIGSSACGALRRSAIDFAESRLEIRRPTSAGAELPDQGSVFCEPGARGAAEPVCAIRSRRGLNLRNPGNISAARMEGPNFARTHTTQAPVGPEANSI